jgi:hypothetical protein
MGPATRSDPTHAFGPCPRRHVLLGLGRHYVKAVLDVDAERLEDDLPTPTLMKISRIMEPATEGRGNDGTTLWARYNGVTGFLGYEYGRSQNRRLDALWWEENAKRSREALEAALAMAV